MLALCRGPRDGGGELALRFGRVGTYSQMSEEGWGGWEVTVNYPWPRDLASNYIWIPSSNLFWTCVGSLKPVYGLLCLFWTCVWFMKPVRGLLCLFWTCVWFLKPVYGLLCLFWTCVWFTLLRRQSFIYLFSEPKMVTSCTVSFFTNLM